MTSHIKRKYNESESNRNVRQKQYLMDSWSSEYSGLNSQDRVASMAPYCEHIPDCEHMPQAEPTQIQLMKQHFINSLKMFKTAMQKNTTLFPNETSDKIGVGIRDALKDSKWHGKL